MAQKFICFKDGTDLTQQVLDTLSSSGPTVLKNGSAAPWEVVVTCGTDATANVFSSAIAATQPGDATITGTAPTAATNYLVDAAQQLSPANSLTRAGAAAESVVTKISLVALVLGGFGVFTDLAGGYDRHPTLFTVVTVASFLALALALIALLPQVFDKVPYGNLLAVRAMYDAKIRRRAWLAVFATLALLVALAAALAAFLVSAREGNPQVTLTTSYDNSGDAPVLGYTADLKALPDDAVATVTLLGLNGATDSKGTVLETSTGTRDRTGDATVDNKVPAKGYTSYRIVAEVDWAFESSGAHKRVVESGTVTPGAGG